MNEVQTQSLAVLADPTRPVPARMAAARRLAEVIDPQVVQALISFLHRERPQVTPTPDDDPLAAERCCDIIAVETLHRLGDDTQWAYLLNALRQAGSGWNQQIRESELAAQAIWTIGSIGLIGDVIALCEDGQLRSSINAVKTLVALELPRPATHQSLDDIAEFADSIRVTPLMIAEYVQQILDASRGRLALTDAVVSQLRDQNYRVSEGQVEETTIGRFLREEVHLYALAYYRDDKRTVICTYPEAVRRWRQWWADHQDGLVYRKETSRFALPSPE